MSVERPTMRAVAQALERVAIRHATLAQVRAEAAQRAAGLRSGTPPAQDTGEAPDGR